MKLLVTYGLDFNVKTLLVKTVLVLVRLSRTGCFFFCIIHCSETKQMITIYFHWLIMKMKEKL